MPKSKKGHRLLGEIGVDLGYLNERAVLKAVRRQERLAEKDRLLIGQILLQSGDLTELELDRILNYQRSEKNDNWD